MRTVRAPRFCAACGESFASKCPACGSEPPPGAAFCDHCGTPLTGTTTAAAPPPLHLDPRRPGYTPTHLAEKILTSKTALEGERKQVTVLFADLKGSMELLADRDPEEARQLLDPVLERMMAAVHRYEGTVNQVMGDGIMALFGAPIAHEDHAVRACYAALHMQEVIGQYADELLRHKGVDVQIRVGLNSGEVVVRSIGSDLHMDYTAVGQTTHLAARMEQLARPGTTRLTADTLRLVEGLRRGQTVGAGAGEGAPGAGRGLRALAGWDSAFALAGIRGTRPDEVCWTWDGTGTAPSGFGTRGGGAWSGDRGRRRNRVLASPACSTSSPGRITSTAGFPELTEVTERAVEVRHASAWTISISQPAST